MAGDSERYEFQRLHGMGKSLHENLIGKAGVRSRIYAPVGQHKDLLPYLVRRLLENGANSSFVNQLIDPAIEISEIVRDPMVQVEENRSAQNPAIVTPTDLFNGTRQSAKGMDLTHSLEVAEAAEILQWVQPFKAASIVGGVDVSGAEKQVYCPTDGDLVGTVQYGTEAAIDEAISAGAASSWLAESTETERAVCMNKAADLLEEEAAVFIQLCVKEAGKSLPDTIAELREAIDFCRYYAGESTSERMADRVPLGVVACISPWNFPLAIFLGQIAAALSAGNVVVVKPAAQTQLIAY
ncbi:MAG: proline dehydrogenase family protein, partial [Kordiimonadaceae bacterium]|nr:proline dehydrogenase family protein [Kordiimonadaceae bacterium]